MSALGARSSQCLWCVPHMEENSVLTRLRIARDDTIKKCKCSPQDFYWWGGNGDHVCFRTARSLWRFRAGNVTNIFFPFELGVRYRRTLVFSMDILCMHQSSWLISYSLGKGFHTKWNSMRRCADVWKSIASFFFFAARDLCLPCCHTECSCNLLVSRCLHRGACSSVSLVT